MDVLLVDRSSALRERFASALREMPEIGAVMEAGTAAEAREATRAHPPNVAIVELLLEGGGTVDLVRDLKARVRRPHIILLLSNASPSYRDWCLSVADDCLDKTGDAEALVRALRNQIAAMRAGRADSKSQATTGGRGARPAVTA